LYKQLKPIHIMTLKSKIRNYKMSDAALVQLADSIKTSAERDATELAAYGVDPAEITALQTARDAFSETDTDEELSGYMVTATQNKNAKREELLIATRQISDRARIAFGETHGKFRTFGASGLSKLNDNELVRTGRRIARVATDFLADMAGLGLTVPIIDDQLLMVADFDDLIDVQDAAIKRRDISVDERIGVGNALYELLVTLAAKGKLCWQDTNEAKYNDYILTSSSSSAPESSMVEGSVAGMTVVNASISGFGASTVFTLKNTGSDVLQFFFAALPTDTSGPLMTAVPPFTTQVRSATALGFNEEGEITRFNIYNPAPTTGSYEVEWI